VAKHPVGIEGSGGIEGSSDHASFEAKAYDDDVTGPEAAWWSERRQAARSYAAGYETPGSDAHFYARRLELVCRLVQDCPAGTVLDAGCGPGILIERLQRTLEAPFQIVGLDVDPGMLLEARDRVGPRDDVRFVRGSLDDLPLPSGSFDVALALGSLEYTDVARSLSELARVTRPGGTVIVSMLNPRSPYRLCERLIQRLRNSPSAHPFMPRIEHLYTVEQIGALLRGNGLLPDRIVYYDMNLCPPPFDQRFPRFAQDVAERFEFLARSPLRALGTAFVVRCRIPRAGS